MVALSTMAAMPTMTTMALHALNFRFPVEK
jgi:hypothetical protein